MKGRNRWIAIGIILAELVSLAVASVRAGSPAQESQPPDASGAQAASSAPAAPLGTAFTYQGRLDGASGPVNGDCAMEFRLYDHASNPSQVGSTIAETVPISDGLFTVALDFGGGVFSGDARWLGVQVQCPGDPGFTDLGRQELTPAPYALHAAHAGIASDVEAGAITPTHLNGLSGNGSGGQLLASDGSGGFAWQAAAAAPVRQLVQDFSVLGGESISAGDVVALLNGEAYALAGPKWGSESVFNAAWTDCVAISALSDTVFVVAYQDGGNSYYGTAIVGTLSGGSVTWGAESVFNAAYTNYIAISTLSDTSFVVVYTDAGNSGYGTARVGTLSGGNVTWGAESVFNAGLTSYNSVSALSNTNFVAAYRDEGNFDYGTAIMGTVSGGNVSWGSEMVFNAAGTDYIAVSALRGTLWIDDFVVAYQDGGNSYYGTVRTGTLSGGSVTWGAESVFNAARTDYIAVSAALVGSGFVVTYRDGGNSYYGTARGGSFSGGNLSWGAESVFNADPTEDTAVSALSGADFVVAYTDVGNCYNGTARVSRSSTPYGKMWEDELVVINAGSTRPTVSALSSTDFVVAYRDPGNSDYGTVGRVGRMIGTAKTAASGGGTVTVIIDGVSDVHSGLLPGSVYYLQADGSLGLTRTAFRIGLAISETELLLDRLW